jgi:hypothetical protein
MYVQNPNTKKAMLFWVVFSPNGDWGAAISSKGILELQKQKNHGYTLTTLGFTIQ